MYDLNIRSKTPEEFLRAARSAAPERAEDICALGSFYNSGALLGILEIYFSKFRILYMLVIK